MSVGPLRSAADRFHIVAVGSSAGGIKALTRLLGELPSTFPVPVLIVQHLDPRHETVIAEVLGRRTSLKVKIAEHDEMTRAGVAYMAPPDRHLLVGPGGLLALTSTEPVHFVRPSVDRLLESAARTYGPAVLACVLTGSGSDGATGVRAIKDRGGTVVVEDPDSAEFAGMPRAAADTGKVDFVLPLEEIAAAVRRLVEGGRA